MTRCILIAIVASVPVEVRADGVGNEVTVGTSESTPGNPRSAYISDRLWLSTDVRDVVTVRAEGSFTRDAAAAPDGGWSLDDQGGNIFRLGTSLDYYPSDHVALGVDADFSPETETSTSTPIRYVDAMGTLVGGTAEVLSATSTYGFGVDGEYDSAGESSFEWVAGASAGMQTFSSYQRVMSVRDDRGMPIDTMLLEDTCRTRECAAELDAALDGEQKTLRQVRLSANALGTIRTDTDVGVAASYYLYTSDPTGLGYFSLAAFGRDQALGEGLQLAPLRFSARPSVVHRIGRVQLGTWFQYGRYVADEGQAVAVGLRVQVRLGAFRIWGAAVGQKDFSGDDSPRSASVSLGARVRF